MLIRVRFETGDLARRIRNLSVRLDTTVLPLVRRRVAQDAVEKFRRSAPHASRRLQNAIHAEELGGTTEVRANPVSEDGYEYIGVTRWGHKLRVIRPIHARSFTSEVNGTKSRTAMRYTSRGQILYRAEVRGYHPHSDWVDRPITDINANAKQVLASVGRGLFARL